MTQHTGGIAVVLFRYEHGHARVGDAPSIAGDDAGAAQLARADGCVTAQEIRRVVGVDAGVDILRQRVGLGNLGVGIAVVDILAGAVGEQLALHVAADLGRVLIVRVGAVLQIGDHAVQRRLIGCRDAAVELLLEGQLALDGGGEAVGQRLHHGVVLLLLLAGQLAPLIARHGLIAGLQVFDLLLRRGVQLGHIIGQGVQQAAELLQIEPVAVVGAVLQQLDVLHGLLLGVAGSAGGLSGVDGRHGGVVSLLHLLPLLGGEVALGVILVIIDGVQLRFQLLLHGAQIAGSRYMHQHGSTHGVAALVVQAESIQQGIALAVQRHTGLAGGVGNGVGIRAQIAGGGILGGGGSLAAIDLRAGHGAGIGVEVRQRHLRCHADGEGLARLHLHRGGDGAVTEPIADIDKRCGIAAAVLAGVGDPLWIDPYQRQCIAVVQLDGRKHAVFVSGAPVAVCTVTFYQLAVQEYQRLGIHVIALQPVVAVQQVIGAGVGVQRHGAGIGILIVNGGKLARALESGVKGIQHGYLYRDLILRNRLQPVGSLAQRAPGLTELNVVVGAHIGDHKLVRQLLRLRQGCPQRCDTFGGIAAQVGVGIAVIIALDLFDNILNVRFCVAAGVCIQRLAGGFQLRRHGLDAFVCGGLVVGQVGVALGVKHGGHQGLGLVAGGLIGRPGFGGVSTLVAGGGALQRLIQRRGVGLADGDQVGDSGGEVIRRSLHRVF